MPEIGQRGKQKSTGKDVIYTERGWVLDDGGNFFFQKGEAIPGTWEAMGADVGKAIGSGMQEGFANTIGLPGSAAGWLAQKLGFEGTPLPTMGEMREKVAGAAENIEQLAPGLGTEADIGYQPETTAGDYAKTLAEFSGGALLPGGTAPPGNMMSR